MHIFHTATGMLKLQLCVHVNGVASMASKHQCMVLHQWYLSILMVLLYTVCYSSTHMHMVHAYKYVVSYTHALSIKGFQCCQVCFLCQFVCACRRMGTAL